MADRREHNTFGAILGGLAAALSSRATNGGDLLREIIAGAAGGYLGSSLADVLEPPTSPNHRSVFHGIALNGLAAYHGTGPLLRWRTRGGQPATDPAGAPTNRDDALMSAFALGAASGHASHLLLDSETPRGLPLLK